MKRFLVLLVLLAGGLVAAALVIPTNAAVVNGAAISQQQLNSGVHAVAGSPDYQCFINSETYIDSQGSAAAPPVAGAGTGQNPGDLPTATTDFTAQYLNQEISQETVEQLAAKRGVTVSQAQLDNARSAFENEITQVMAEVAQTAEGENPAFSCSDTGKPLTGGEVLATLPPSFVDQQVQYVASQIALADDLSGYGSSAAELLRYYQSHLSTFDTACFTVAVYSSESDATAAKASVASGTPFATVAASTQSSGGGPQGCAVSYEVDRDLPANSSLEHMALNTVSDPIAFNSGSFILIEVTKRTPTAFSSVKPLVADAVQQAGAAKAQAAVTAAERRSDISVNPQYGVWVSLPGQILIPLAPEKSDVPNAKANEPATATSSTGSSASSSPFSG